LLPDVTILLNSCTIIAQFVGQRVDRFQDISDSVETGETPAMKRCCHTLTRSWTADVDALEMAIGRLTSRRPLTDDCRVALFEVVGDGAGCAIRDIARSHACDRLIPKRGTGCSS
jgi:hypothetical protein